MKNGAVEKNTGNNRLKDTIEEVCSQVGPRPSGSAAEEEAAGLLKEKLEGWGVKAKLEDFSMAPGALHILLVVLFAGYVLAYLIYFIVPPITFAILIVLFGTYIAQIVFGAGIFTALFKKSKSPNVIGRIKPEGETKRILLFSAHHDSAYRMPLMERRTHRIVFILLPLFILTAIALIALSGWKSWILYAAPAPAAWSSIVETALIRVCGAGVAAAYILMVGTIRPDAVMGANDNLSGVAVAFGAARELARKKPEHTEVWILSFGSEEAGLLGSADFARRHADELKGGIVINLECLGQRGTLRLITGELMGATMSSPEALDLIEKAAKESGVEVKRKYLTAGLTDSTSFRRRGISAATLIRLDELDYFEHYHTPGDDVSSVREENLQEALKICLKIVKLVDE